MERAREDGAVPGVAKWSEVARAWGDQPPVHQIR